MLDLRTIISELTVTKYSLLNMWNIDCNALKMVTVLYCP